MFYITLHHNRLSTPYIPVPCKDEVRAVVSAGKMITMQCPFGQARWRHYVACDDLTYGMLARVHVPSLSTCDPQTHVYLAHGFWHWSEERQRDAATSHRDVFRQTSMELHSGNHLSAGAVAAIWRARPTWVFAAYSTFLWTNGTLYAFWILCLTVSGATSFLSVRLGSLNWRLHVLTNLHVNSGFQDTHYAIFTTEPFIRY